MENKSLVKELLVQWETHFRSRITTVQIVNRVVSVSIILFLVFLKDLDFLGFGLIGWAAMIMVTFTQQEQRILKRFVSEIHEEVSKIDPMNEDAFIRVLFGVERGRRRPDAIRMVFLSYESFLWTVLIIAGAALRLFRV